MTESTFANMNSLPPFSKFIESISDNPVTPLRNQRLPRAFYSQPQTPSARIVGLPVILGNSVQFNSNEALHSYSNSLYVSPYRRGEVGGDFRSPGSNNVNGPDFDCHNGNRFASEEHQSGSYASSNPSHNHVQSLNLYYRFPGESPNHNDIQDHLRKLLVYYNKMSNVILKVASLNSQLHDNMLQNYTATVSYETLSDIFALVPLSTFTNLEFYSQETVNLCQNLILHHKTILLERELIETSRHAPKPIRVNNPRNMSTGLLPSISKRKKPRRNPKLHAVTKSDPLLIKQSRPNSLDPSSAVSSRKGSFINFDSQKKRIPSPANCSHCGSRSTPEWRRGPAGDKTLCNACGLFYSKLIKKLHSPDKAAQIMNERKANGQLTDRHIS